MGDFVRQPGANSSFSRRLETTNLVLPPYLDHQPNSLPKEKASNNLQSDSEVAFCTQSETVVGGVIEDYARFLPGL